MQTILASLFPVLAGAVFALAGVWFEAYLRRKADFGQWLYRIRTEVFLELLDIVVKCRDAGSPLAAGDRSRNAETNEIMRIWDPACAAAAKARLLLSEGDGKEIERIVQTFCGAQNNAASVRHDRMNDEYPTLFEKLQAALNKNLNEAKWRR